MLLAISACSGVNAAYHFEAGDGTANQSCRALACANWLNTANPDWSFIKIVDNYVINVRFEEVNKAPAVNDWTAIDTVLAFADRAKKKG